MTIFSSLFKGLHIEPQNPENYASYQKMVCDVTDVMKTRNNTERLYMHALKMKEIYLEMSYIYNKKALLHWDMNNENILLCKNGMYKIIDPMGIIGDPIMEIGRYISKEYADSPPERKFVLINKIFDYFEINLQLPKIISKRCFYIDIIFLNCHFVEHGAEACMDDIRFAEAVLTNTDYEHNPYIR